MEGEATGHHHSLVATDFQMYKDENGVKYLELHKNSEISHQEHGTLPLVKGKYIVHIEREFDPFADLIRQVQD